jgi:hypothetical protein
MTWLETVERAFVNLGGSAVYSDLFREIGRLRGRALTKNQKSNVCLTIQCRSSESRMNERRKRRPYVFYSVGGLGSGHWGLLGKKGKSKRR